MSLVRIIIERKGQVGRIMEQLSTVLQRTAPGVYHISIEKEKAKRSLGQNSYYWSVALPAISGYLGIDVDSVHRMMQFKFLRRAEAIETPAGTVRLEYVVSTTQLSPAEFAEYVRLIVRWAAEEWGISIPEPNEVRG